MFGIFKNTRNDARKDIFLMVELNKNADQAHKIMAGITLNQISNIFSARFAGIDGFLGSPKQEQYAYIDSLIQMEKDLSTHENIDYRLGVFAVVTFRMWLCMHMEKDSELIILIESILDDMSRAADGF